MYLKNHKLNNCYNVNNFTFEIPKFFAEYPELANGMVIIYIGAPLVNLIEVFRPVRHIKIISTNASY